MSRTRAAYAAALALYALAAPAVAGDELEVVIQYAYGNVERYALEGRVIEQRRAPEASGADSWWRNLWRQARRLVSDEEDEAALVLTLGGRTHRLQADEEGYFRLAAGTPAALNPGWHPIGAGVEGRAAPVRGDLLIVAPENRTGLISDFDDTVIVSEVLDKSRLLANTLLNNYRQRRPAPGMAEWYRRLVASHPKPAAAPVFYLTASPRSLQVEIEAFLAHHGYPRGVVIGKRVTGEARDPLLDPERYKTARLEEILARLPDVRFTLVGDDGERDPEVFHDLRTRFPERVAAVYIRRVHPDPKRARFPDQFDAPAARAAP